jgi:hypothetical protein
MPPPPQKTVHIAPTRNISPVFHRIESSIYNPDTSGNLKAEVRDPLWMLTRQWQFGEFVGEDAGSPFIITVEAARTMNLADSPPVGHPLEPYVESVDNIDSLYTRIISGQYLEALLPASSIGIFLKKFGLMQNEVLNPALINEINRQNDAHNLYVSLREIQIDGILVMQFLAQEKVEIVNAWITNNFSQADGTSSKVLSILDKFKLWFAEKYPKTNHWRTISLDYKFPLNSNTTPPLSISVDQYAGGQLDWYDIKINAESQGRLNQTTHSTDFFPTSCTYKGMPSARFWELEDGSVNLRRIDVPRTAILDVLFFEYNYLYSNDWFVIPYSMNVGETCLINSIKVIDVFGGTIQLDSGQTVRSNRKFSLFNQAVSYKNPPVIKSPQVLFLFPRVSNMLESQPIEQVHFMLDEMSNLVWGVESILPNQLGAGTSGAKLSDTLAPSRTQNDGLLHYTMYDKVPDHWTPFMSVPIQDIHGSKIYQRAKLYGGSTYKGMILGNDKTINRGTQINGTQINGYFINEEEISPLGCVITKTYQRARGAAGEILNWIGMSNGVGRGQGSVGLVFDQLIPSSDNRAELRHMLMPGKSITSYETSILSKNGKYRLGPDPSGTITFTKENGNQPSTVISNFPWNSSSANVGPNVIKMTENGVLLVQHNDLILWKFSPPISTKCMLIISDDGFLIIVSEAFEPLWWGSAESSNRFNQAAFDITAFFG